MTPEQTARCREWIARLRDPNAKQRRRHLGAPTGERCCLGVACDIAVEHGVIPPPTVKRRKCIYDNEKTASGSEYGFRLTV